MKPFTALQQKRHDLKAEAEGLADKIGALTATADEQARGQAVVAELAQLDQQIEAMEKLRAAERTAPAFSGMRDLAGDRPWAGFGEFLQAVAGAGTPGGYVDPRLYAATGSSTGVPSDGGFLVRTDYSTMLLERGMESSKLAPLCTSIEVGPDADSIEAPYVDETSRATGSRWGGVQVYRRGEADTVTATKPKLGKFELRLEDMMGLYYTTERALRDASSLQAIATKAFASEFGFKLDNEIIRGTGAGECLGILNSSALVTQAKETGQGAASIITINISRMWARLVVRSRGTAVWLHNQDCEPQLDELALYTGVSALEPRFVNYGPDGILRIKGRPALAIEQAETLGTVGDFMLADFSEYLLITKGGIVPAESMHVRFNYNERTFRWVYSINGAPTWNTVRTPFKGTANTVAPYVALATRA